jgi:hypothetical protein
VSWGLDVDEAVELAQEYLDALAKYREDNYIVINTTERDWGWIVGWTSERARDEPDNLSVQLAGNGPLLIARKAGEVTFAGSGKPADEYAAEWRSGAIASIARPPDQTAPAPWFDLRWRWGTETQRAAMLAELCREASPGHALHGTNPVAVAKCSHCDDVAFEQGDGKYAVVHLTWSRREERPPWPRASYAPDWSALLAIMESHDQS